MRHLRLSFFSLLLCAAAAALLACDASSLSATVPSCTWPTTLDDGSASATCTTGRAYVQCTGGSGSCGALESDPSSSCLGLAASSTTCGDICALTQYAVSCGGSPLPDGSVANPEVPAGCEARATGTSSGPSVYCCACE